MTIAEKILGLLTRPKTGRELTEILPHARGAVYRALARLEAAGTVQKRGRKYVRTGAYVAPPKGMPAKPDGAGAAARALGIARPTAYDGIKAGRIVYRDGQWTRTPAPRGRPRRERTNG